MNVEEAYKHWSEQYDTNLNKTRDLEAVSLRDLLQNIQFNKALEIGCGTGKNTEYLVTKGNQLLSIDLSEAMLAVAQEKIKAENVNFLKVDINQDWDFTTETFDLVVCSLVLEHIENIERVFQLISERLNIGGILYIGELHPFKQYSGSKARFENENGEEQIVTCFTHNVSDFTRFAKQNNLQIDEIKEYSDDQNETEIPRILAMKFIKI